MARPEYVSTLWSLSFLKYPIFKQIVLSGLNKTVKTKVLSAPRASVIFYKHRGFVVAILNVVKEKWNTWKRFASHFWDLTHLLRTIRFSENCSFWRIITTCVNQGKLWTKQDRKINVNSTTYSSVGVSEFDMNLCQDGIPFFVYVWCWNKSK